MANHELPPSVSRVEQLFASSRSRYKQEFIQASLNYIDAVRELDVLDAVVLLYQRKNRRVVVYNIFNNVPYELRTGPRYARLNRLGEAFNDKMRRITVEHHLIPNIFLERINEVIAEVETDNGFIISMVRFDQ